MFKFFLPLCMYAEEVRFSLAKKRDYIEQPKKCFVLVSANTCNVLHFFVSPLDDSDHNFCHKPNA